MDTGAGSQIALEAYTRSSPPFPAHQFFPGGGRTSDSLNGACHTSCPTRLTTDSSASPRCLESLQHATYNGHRMEWDMKSWDWDSVLFLAQPSVAAAAGLDDHRSKSSSNQGGARNSHAQNGDQRRHPSILNGIDFGLDGGSSNPDLNGCSDVDDPYHRGKYLMRSQETANPSHSGKTQPFLRDGSSPDEDDTESLSLKLGGHSYAYSEEGGNWSRDAKRYRSSSPGPQFPSCQVDDCKADLSHAKDYHRRHKVCEQHAKAVKALVSRLMQRFCQQCSRFHPLPEFDEGKRSCRRRLAGHNRRRRKNHPDTPPGRAYGGDENEAVGKAAGLVGILNLLSSLQAVNSAGPLNGIGNERDAVLQYLKAMVPAPASLEGLTPAAVANLLSLSGLLPDNRPSDAKLLSFVTASRGQQHPPSNIDAELLSVLGNPQTREEALELMLQQSSWRGQVASALMKAAAMSSPLVQVGQNSGNCASRPLAAANPGATRLTGNALTHANGGPVLSLSSPAAARPVAVPNFTSSSRANGVHRQAIPENSVRQAQQFQAALLQAQAAPVAMAQKLFPSAQEAAGQGANSTQHAALNVEDDGATGSTSDHDAPAASVMPSFADGQEMRILQDVSQQSRPTIDLQQPAFQYDTNESSPSGSDQSPSSSSADWQDRTGRISIKLFDRNPGELPHLLRAQILDWLAHRPSDMESYIRPGCIVLTVFLSMPSSAWSELERNLRASLQKLTQYGQFWSSGRIHMQVDRRNAFVVDGKIHISKPLKATTPQLLSVRPCAVVAGQRTSIFLRGVNLSQPGTRIFIAYQGQYATKEVPPANAYSRLRTGGWDEQSICFDAGCPDVVGRAFIEVEKQLSGGNALPIIVADGAVCAELRMLEEAAAHISDGGEETSDHRVDSRADISHPLYAKNFLNELGWLFQKSQIYYRVVDGEGAGASKISPSRQKDLLTFAVTQNWSAVVSKILDIVFGLVSACPERNTAGLSEVFGDEMSFLHLAVEKRCLRVVQLLLSYVPFVGIDSAERKVILKDVCKHDSQNGHIFTPDMSGPVGLTPLHIAASLDGAEDLIDALTNDPNQVGLRAWATACNAEGDSPQVRALNTGNASYVEMVRRKIARRDGSVTITIPPGKRVSSENDLIRAGGESCSDTAGSTAWAIELSTWSNQDPAVKISGGTKSVTVPRSCRHVPPILQGMRRGSIYRPFLLSMMAIAAVCVCACIIMRGSPDVNARHSFSWASLAYGPQ